MTYRIKNELDSDDEFQATYKGYSVHVKREGLPDDDDDWEWWDGEGQAPSDYWSPGEGQAFYIQVRSEAAFGTAYDGWWGNADNTLEEAVEEALIGSCLIEQSQRKFKVAA